MVGEEGHDGHRQRLKERFIRQNLDGFNAINTLELILFYSVPRKDTNPLAHRLLDRFGNITNVFEASYEDLLTVKDITENTATLIKLMLSFCRYYSCEKDNNNQCITSLEDAGRYVAPMFIGMTDEIAVLIMLDAKGKVLLTQKLSEGTKDSTPITPRKVAEIALRNGAQKVILAHNHPGGIAIPSQEDFSATSEVVKALSLFGIRLLDHIVVADGDYISFRQSGFLND